MPTWIVEYEAGFLGDDPVDGLTAVSKTTEQLTLLPRDPLGDQPVTGLSGPESRLKPDLVTNLRGRPGNRRSRRRH